MKNDVFLYQILNDVHADLVHLTKTKGVEYKAGDDDQLANFKRLSKELNLPMESILWVYLNKHLDSIRNHIRKLPVRLEEPTGSDHLSEPIRGRILDAILYLHLLMAMVHEREDMVRASHSST